MRYFEKQSSTAMTRKFAKGIFSTKTVSKMNRTLTARGHEVKPRMLKNLGQGSEGTADLVTHSRGVAVQKAYDRSGMLYSKDLIKAKNKIMKTTTPGENITKYYGQHPKYDNVHYHEYSSGNAQSKFGPSIKKGIESVKKRTGVTMVDVADGHNISGNKIIDFLPAQQIHKTTGSKMGQRMALKTKRGKELSSEIKAKSADEVMAAHPSLAKAMKDYGAKKVDPYKMMNVLEPKDKKTIFRHTRKKRSKPLLTPSFNT